MRGAFIPVFIFGVLLVVILGGFLKTVIPSHRQASGSGWNGQTSLAVAVNSKPPAIVVYSKELSKLGVFSVSANLKYATGNAGEPVKTVADLFSGPGSRTEAVLSNLLGVNVSRYVYFQDVPGLQQGQVYEMFKQFSSVKTPMAIILGRTAFTSDLSKMEQLKFWWEVKGLTFSQIDFKSLNDFSEEVIGEGNKKFKAIDRESVVHEMTNYFDSGINSDVEILNNSGEVAAGGLAANMLGAYGWNVVKVETSTDTQVGCTVMDPGRSNDAAWLAGIFGCNIIRGQNAGSGNTVIVLGSNFAKRYF